MLVKKILLKILHFFNFYQQTDTVFHHPSKNVLFPSYVLSFNEAETRFLEISAHCFNYLVDYSRGFRQKEVYTVLLRQVTFLGHSGALLSGDKVITESVFDGMRLSKSPAFRFPALLWPRKKKGRYTSLMHDPWATTSNYHWFLDALPRICLLLEQQELLQVIVPRLMPAFQQETLAFLIADKPGFSLVPITRHEKWEVEEFVFSSFVAHHNSGYLPASIIRLIREKVWKGYGVQEALVGKRLFISRAKAGKRRILNEEALWPMLTARGFEVIFAEDLTYQQQVQLFYQAEIVVGAHGAGLTNVLFSKQCTLVELHPARQVKSHYFMLCRALDFPYHYLVGSEPDARWNFRVDEAAFSSLISQVLKNE